jgi:hypothetical protein
MRKRDAERRARRFVAEVYACYAHWNFDICVEFDGNPHDRRKSWSFGLAPDEEDADYEPGRGFVGYVHRDGAIEGLY